MAESETSEKQNNPAPSGSQRDMNRQAEIDARLERNKQINERRQQEKEAQKKLESMSRLERERSLEKEQKAAERAATFEMFRDAKKAAADEGIDLNRASFRTTSTEQGRLIEMTKAQGAPSRKAVEAAEREAVRQAQFQAFRDIKAAAAAEGVNVSSASFRTTKTPTGASRIAVKDVNLAKTVLQQPRPPGVRYAYDVQLRDSMAIGGGRPEGVNYAYDVQLKEQFGQRKPPAPKEQFKPASDDPFSGARAVGENVLDSFVTSGKVLSKAPSAFAGNQQAWYDIEYELARYDERWKPELEGGAISVGISAAKEKITTGQTSGAAKQFEDLTKSIVENPSYFVGSGVASAAMWFGPGAGAKVRGIVKGAREVSTKARSFEVLQKSTPDLFPRAGAVEVTRNEKKFVEAFTPGITSVQQVGKTKMFDFGTELTEPSVSRYVGGRINPKTGDIDLITRELLEKPEQFVVPKSRRSFVYDLESYGVKQVKEGQPRKVGMAKGSDIYDPEKLRIEKVTELPTKMPEMPIFRSSTIEREMQTFIDPFREQRGKLVATIETFKPSELEAYARAISRPAQSASATPSVRSFTPRTPRTRSQPAASSQPQVTVQPRLSNVEKATEKWAQDALKADAKGSSLTSDLVKVGAGAGIGASALGSAPSALGLYGGENIFTSRGSIGFGGATGAERKRRKQDDFEYTIGLNRIPGVSSRQFNKGLITPDMRDALDVGSRFRGGTTTRDTRAQNQALAQYNKMLKDLQPRLDTGTRSLTGLKTDTLATTKTAQAEALALRQQLSQVFGRATMQGRIQSSRVIPRMRVPRTRLLPLPQYSPPRVRRGGKKKRGLRVRQEKQDVTDLVALGFGKDYAKAFNKQFGLKDIYDT